MALVNSGSVAINSGTLKLSGGGSSSSGSFAVPAATTLDFNSSYALNGTTQVSGPGSVTLASGTLTLASGVIYDVTGGLSGTGGSATFGTGDTFGPSIVQSGGGTIVLARHHAADAGHGLGQRGTLNFSTGLGDTITTLNLTGGTLTGTDTLTVSGLTTWSSQSTLSGAAHSWPRGG